MSPNFGPFRISHVCLTNGKTNGPYRQEIHSNPHHWHQFAQYRSPIICQTSQSVVRHAHSSSHHLRQSPLHLQLNKTSLTASLTLPNGYDHHINILVIFSKTDNNIYLTQAGPSLYHHSLFSHTYCLLSRYIIIIYSTFFILSAFWQ